MAMSGLWSYLPFYCLTQIHSNTCSSMPTLKHVYLPHFHLVNIPWIYVWLCVWVHQWVPKRKLHCIKLYLSISFTLALNRNLWAPSRGPNFIKFVANFVAKQINSVLKFERNSNAVLNWWWSFHLESLSVVIRAQFALKGLLGSGIEDSVWEGLYWIASVSDNFLSQQCRNYFAWIVVCFGSWYTVEVLWKHT